MDTDHRRHSVPGQTRLIAALAVAIALALSGCAGPLTSGLGFATENEDLAKVSAGPAAIAPTPTPMKLDWSSYAALAELELSFYDMDANATVHVTGPYRVVYWDENRVDLIGVLDSGFGEEAELSLLKSKEQLWAHLTIEAGQYLTRVH